MRLKVGIWDQLDKEATDWLRKRYGEHLAILRAQNRRRRLAALFADNVPDEVENGDFPGRMEYD